jgi:adenylate cyclase
VQVTAGEDRCPPPAPDERATLARIHAAPDVRLACQLRPSGDISVVPLVRTALPVYRAAAQPSTHEREIVVMYCDFANRERVAREALAQDLLHLLTLYGDAIANAIRAAGGTIGSIGPDGICALFGLDHDIPRAARLALQAATGIERAVADLDQRVGREGARKLHKLEVAVTIHAGDAVVGEIGSNDVPAHIAVGEAVEAANELRKAAAAHTAFAISEPVTSAAGVEPAAGEKVMLAPHGASGTIAAVLSSAPPALPITRSGLAERRAALQRLWSGR